MSDVSASLGSGDDDGFEQTDVALSNGGEQRERAATLQTLTAELARISSSAEVASFVLNEGVARLGGTSGSLCLVSAGELELSAAVGYSSDVLSAYRRFPIDMATPAGEVALTRRAVYCESLDELYERYEIFRHNPVVGDPSVAVLPLEASDATVLGTMVVGFSTARSFDDSERSLLEAIAREASVALERARANESLIEARDQLAFLAEASTTLAASLEFYETTRHLGALAVPKIADSCALYLREDKRIEEVFVVPQATLGETASVGGRDLSIDDEDGVGAVIRVRAPTFRPEVGGERGATLLVPLAVRGECFGALVYSNHPGRAFSVSQRELASELSARAAVAIDNARLYTRELSIAETLQRALLPARLPEIPGVRFASRYVPGIRQLEVGGDWYSATILGDQRFGFVVGDVSGRGLQAATTMASVRYTVRALAFEGNSPDEVLRKCGAQLDLSEQGRFATALVGIVDMAHRELTIANAGHLRPLLVSGDKAEFVDVEPGLPIGVRKDATYTSKKIVIPPGAMLLCFTDGLVERRGEGIDAGMQRLYDAVMANPGPVDDVLSMLLQELTSGRPDDDVAILGVQWER